MNKGSHKRVFRNAALVAGLLVALVGYGSSASASSNQAQGITKTAIHIGTTNTLTGPIGPDCAPVSEGAQAWFDKVNASGGVYGRKIVDNVRDDAGEASNAVTNARAFVQQDDFVVFGGCGSFQPPAMIPILKAAGIPYLFPDASPPAVPTNNPLVFGVYTPYGPQLETAWKSAVALHGTGSAVLFTEDFPGYQSLVSVVKSAVHASGGKYLGTILAPSSAPSYMSYMLKVKSMHPDYLIAQISSNEMAAALKQLQSINGLPTKGIVGDSIATVEPFLSGIGNTVDGKMIATAVVAPPSSPRAASCSTALKAKGIAPGGLTLLGCGTAQALVTALKDVGPNPTRSKLLHVLNGWKNVQASAVLPPITFAPGKHLGVSQVYVDGFKSGANYEIKLATVAGS